MEYLTVESTRTLADATICVGHSGGALQQRQRICDGCSELTGIENRPGRRNAGAILDEWDRESNGLIRL